MHSMKDTKKRAQLIRAVEHVVESRSEKSIELLLLPEVLMAMPFDVLKKLPLVNSAFNRASKDKDDMFGYWNAISHSFAREYGLYLPVDKIVSKAAFFTDIWPLRTKWRVNEAEAMESGTYTTSNTFKIQVASRSRPGATPKDSLNLPLHQFLKIKRRQQQESAGAHEAGKPLVGDNPPEEFVDPILNSLLKDPVLLKTSKRVVSRSVAVQSILRGGRDPFNNFKLTHAHIEDLPELAARIEEYKVERAKQDDVSVGRKEIMKFVEGSAVDPAILEALIEADRISSASDRAEMDALDEVRGNKNKDRKNKTGGQNGDESEGGDGQSDPETTTESSSGTTAGDVDERIDGNDGSVNEINGDISSRGCFEDGSGNGSRWRKSVKETARIVDVSAERKSVTMHIPGTGIRPFHFNKVFPGSTRQKQVYEESVQNLVAQTLNGFNTCLLCYGQTGSGKTHTMFGPEGALDVPIDEEGGPHEEAGAVVRACMELIQAKKHMAQVGVNVQLNAKMVEIYNEQVSDLLSGHEAAVSRCNGEVIGAIDVPLARVDEVLAFLKAGQARKRFAATAMNDRSSRSHTAIILTVKQSLPEKDAIISSQLTLVDLAGSERIKKSKVTGARATEAIGINSSLLVLGKVIAALVESRRHVPYFESKLTTMLKGAFGGNCRTSVVIASRMESNNGDETLQSLRFGERCGLISNSTLQAATSASSALRAMDDSIAKVRAQMESLQARNKIQQAKKVELGLNDLLAKRETIAVAVGREEAEKNPRSNNNTDDHVEAAPTTVE